MLGFELAAGSVPGTDHTMPGQPGWKNNQDAYDFISGANHLVGVVCDGCGGVNKGHGFSECGARLGARLVTKAMYEMLLTTPSLAESADALLEAVAQRVAEQLYSIAKMATRGESDCDAFATAHFLFTIIGFAITPEHVLVFSCGDGVYAVNGDVTVIPSFPDNMPPYLAYRFLKNSIDPGLVRFDTRALRPVEDVSSVLVGSDGLTDFIRHADTPLPLLTTSLGPISQFWEQDRFITNPDMIRRRLALANREHIVDAVIAGGLLPDDTTLMLARRL
jgi:hypothetical protein